MKFFVTTGSYIILIVKCQTEGMVKKIVLYLQGESEEETWQDLSKHSK